jgi:hypothetical protein
MVVRKPSYVFVTCGQDFTREHGAKRHNGNIHAGTAEIVTFFEYLVGRSSGKYLASDPAAYRLKTRRNTLANANIPRGKSGIPPSLYGNGTDDLDWYNNLVKNEGRRRDSNDPYRRLLDFGLLEPTQNKKSRGPSEDEYIKARAMLAGIEQVLTPFCPPEFVRNVITGLIDRCNVRGNYVGLDEALERHRNNARQYYSRN